MFASGCGVCVLWLPADSSYTLVAQVLFAFLLNIENTMGMLQLEVDISNSAFMHYAASVTGLVFAVHGDVWHGGSCSLPYCSSYCLLACFPNCSYKKFI